MIRVLLFVSLTFSLFGSKGQVPISASADLSGAKQVFVNTPYSFSSSPKGFGLLQEFPLSTKRSAYYFEHERNSVWLTLDIPFNGILSFEIKPHSTSDDYDWMLFEYSPLLKESIKTGRPSLLRSNNSRNDPKVQGKTGTKNGAWPMFEPPGPGRSYSKAIPVKRGQKLALIIDNIYKSGQGFDFISELKPQVTSYRMLSGTVTGKPGKLPLAARIVCEDDSTGFKLSETLCSSDGKYNLMIPADRPANVTAMYPKLIFATADIAAGVKDVEHNFQLVRPESQSNISLFNIHFVPNKDLILPSSIPELGRLIELLKEAEWEIKIIGHTNNNPFADSRFLQRLSFNRAIAVQQYLVERGISKKRMTCLGMGGKKPLIPRKDVDESLKNLRVEVTLTTRE